MIEAVFFDIDGVVFNRDKAEFDAIVYILGKYYNQFNLVNIDSVINEWHNINNILWDKCNKNECTSEEVVYLRWDYLLRKIGCSKEKYQIDIISQEYCNYYCNGKYVVNEINFLIRRLEKIGLKMGIITNGLKRIQLLKLENSNLLQCFNSIITENEAKCRKPHHDIFLKALSVMGVTSNESIYVGNSILDDIIPAMDLGFNTIWYDCNDNYSLDRTQKHLSNRINIAFNSNGIYDFIMDLNNKPKITI